MNGSAWGEGWTEAGAGREIAAWRIASNSGPSEIQGKGLLWEL
ncbi:MAG: hypothetical protein ACK6DN_08280 [Planctomycetota bacterium]|jgi:hypothetical protein